MHYSTNYFSPLGELVIVSDGEAVCGVWFKDQKHPLSSVDEDIIEKDDLAIFKQVKQWFDDYFEGLNPPIDFKLAPNGTDFRKRVWDILSGISYGETITYGEIASQLSDKMSAQAVGGAVGHNPIAILIPCHRVIGKDGKITGFAAGIDRKKYLLNLEGSIKI